MDLVEIDGAVTVRLFEHDLQALALACNLSAYGLLDHLSPDRAIAEQRAETYRVFTAAFEAIACASAAYETLPDRFRREASLEAIRKGWLDQDGGPPGAQ